MKTTLAHIRHFVRRAAKDKAWALSVTGEWKRNACDISLKMASDYASQTIKTIARSSLEYHKMRAKLVSSSLNRPMDPVAFKLWTSLGDQS